MNDWNWHNATYAHAFMDADGDASLVNTLDLAGGVTNGQIEEFVATFKHELVKFVRYGLDNSTKDKLKDALPSAH